MPLPRKGTKYVARALGHVHSGVPVVVAVRDMLRLAKTAREARIMVKQKMIKVNGRIVQDIREPITLFNILEVGKIYRLIILPTGRFSLVETKDNFRLSRVQNKTMLKGKKMQLNFHDGSNIITNEKTNVGDTFEIDNTGKVKKIITFAKGRDAFVISGRSVGNSGKISEVKDGKASVKLENGKEVMLETKHIMVL